MSDQDHPLFDTVTTFETLGDKLYDSQQMKNAVSGMEKHARQVYHECLRYANNEISLSEWFKFYCRAMPSWHVPLEKEDRIIDWVRVVQLATTTEFWSESAAKEILLMQIEKYYGGLQKCISTSLENPSGQTTH